MSHQEPPRPDRLSRRRFLTGSALAIGSVALGACGSGSTGGGGGGAAKGITLLTWETYHDRPWLDEYERESGVKITSIVNGSADELFARAKSGTVKPDLLVFDSGAIPRFNSAGLIEAIDESRIPNLKHETPGLNWKPINTVDGKLLGVPYNWGTQPLIYNSDAVAPAPTSWSALWDPQFKGKVVMFDDAYTTFPMLTIYVGARDPYNLTDAEFEKCREALKLLRPQLKTIAKGFDDAVNIFASGDGVIGYCQNISEVYALQEQGHPFEYSFPREGTPQWTDNFVLGKGAGDRQEVYDFINANLAPAWQARFVESSSNNGILSYEGARAAKLPPKSIEQTNLADQRDASFWKKMVPFRPPEDLDRRLEIWNEFKAGA